MNKEAAWVALLKGIADHQLNIITPVEWIDSILDAALGDKVLYRHATDDDTLADGAESGLFMQVWPK